MEFLYDILDSVDLKPDTPFERYAFNEAAIYADFRSASIDQLYQIEAEAKRYRDNLLYTMDHERLDFFIDTIRKIRKEKEGRQTNVTKSGGIVLGVVTIALIIGVVASRSKKDDGYVKL